MFNVKVEGFEIQFTFNHARDLELDVPVRDVTGCTIIVNGQQFSGVAACSTKDKFEKAVGRKLSLERALENVRKKIELPVHVRTLVWERYFDRGIPNKEWVFTVETDAGLVVATADIPKVAGPVS